MGGDLNEWRDDEEDTLCEEEFDDFIMWLHDEYIQHGELEPEDYEPDAFVGLFEVWRCSSEYAQKALDYEVNQWDGWEGESVVSDHETTVRTCTAAATTRASQTIPKTLTVGRTWVTKASMKCVTNSIARLVRRAACAPRCELDVVWSS